MLWEPGLRRSTSLHPRSYAPNPEPKDPEPHALKTAVILDDVGRFNVGALIMRIGFWGFLIIIIL